MAAQASPGPRTPRSARQQLSSRSQGDMTSDQWLFEPPAELVSSGSGGGGSTLPPLCLPFQALLSTHIVCAAGLPSDSGAVHRPSADQRRPCASMWGALGRTEWRWLADLCDQHASRILFSMHRSCSSACSPMPIYDAGVRAVGHQEPPGAQQHRPAHPPAAAEQVRPLASAAAGVAAPACAILLPMLLAQPLTAAMASPAQSSSPLISAQSTPTPVQLADPRLRAALPVTGVSRIGSQGLHRAGVQRQRRSRASALPAAGGGADCRHRQPRAGGLWVACIRGEGRWASGGDCLHIGKVCMAAQVRDECRCSLGHPHISLAACLYSLLQTA